jgi:hypothetical protein
MTPLKCAAVLGYASKQKLEAPCLSRFQRNALQVRPDVGSVAVNVTPIRLTRRSAELIAPAPWPMTNRQAFESLPMGVTE